MPTQTLETRRLGIAAAVAIGLFPVVVLVLTLVQRGEGYDSGRDAVSDLALGSGGGMMAVAFCSLAVGTLLFAAVLHRTSDGARVRTGLLCLAGVLSFVSAAFHTDRSGAPTTTHGTIHNAAGIITFLAMLAAMALSAWRFRRDSAWRGFSGPTAAFAVVGLIGFVLLPVLGDAHFGLSQRVLIGSFIAWMLTATIYQLRTGLRRTEPENVSVSVGTA